MIAIIGWILYFMLAYGLGYLLGMCLDTWLRPLLLGVLCNV